MPDDEYENILRIVRGWPSDRRFTLVHHLMKSLATSQEVSPRKRETLRNALGVLSMRKAMSDPLFLADLREVAEDFKHVDAEEAK